MSMYEFTQHPMDRLAYSIKLTGDDTDAITNVGTTVISPSGDLVEDGASYSGMTAQVWLKGGIADNDYAVRVPITTSKGRLKQAQFIIKVRDE